MPVYGTYKTKLTDYDVIIDIYELETCFDNIQRCLYLSHTSVVPRGFVEVTQLI